MRPGTIGRVWAHPLAPGPVLAVAGLALAALVLLEPRSGAPTVAAWIVVAWIVLALSAGYAVSGSV